MANENATIIVGSARQEHSAVFSVRQVFIHRIYNKPVTEAGRIMPWLRFFAFTGKAVV